MNRLGCGVLASVCEPFYGEPSREETRMRARRLDGVMRSEVGNLVQPSQKGGMMEIAIKTIEKKEKERVPEWCYKELGIEYICNGKMQFQLIRPNSDRTAVIITRKCDKCGRIAKITQGYFTL